ncbi:MAG: pyruvate synthase [Lachnospiraceae bacterium]|nr:pyruvate synthase [Lachnospiraceae bacterium]
MEKQIMEYASGNEMAAIAIRQIGYDVMGYYPITPSTQIAENLDIMKAEGKTDLMMIPAEGEHSAAGICYGASVGGGRVVNATSANGLLYAIEQFPVQSGTRYPMVMNLACRTVSGPLSIKGDHSDVMYLLSAGWPILFAHTAQQVYDFNIIALRLAEQVRLPVAVAFDGFFTSHQKRKCHRFAEDETVRNFLGEKKEPYPFFDFEHPITVGSYMNEPDIMNNRYQLRLAMDEAQKVLPQICREFASISGRSHQAVEGYGTEDAQVLLVLLGSSYETAIEAVDRMRKQGGKVGVVTLNTLRPFPAKELAEICQAAETILVADRQDTYGGGGGSFSIEVRAAMQRYGSTVRIKSLVYGMGGQDFFVEDAMKMFQMAADKEMYGFGNIPDDLGYYHVEPGQNWEAGSAKKEDHNFFAPLTEDKTKIGATQVIEEEGKLTVKGGTINATAQMPKRLAPGHGACPGCGIPVNLNLLLRGIENPVVLLFQTGCAMIVTTGYPKTSLKVPYVHNLFQNGAATLSGLAEMCYRKQEKGEMPKGEIVFIMVSGDGGLDIGMGSALGTAMRGHRLLIFEYDNGGYMNTGYQLSYSTPKGARSSTSHIGEHQFGKTFFHKDMPQLMAAANIPYVATAAESNPADFIKKAAKAAEYAMHHGTAYLKAISACPLNWNDRPDTERSVIEAAVNSCYFPLYEVEQGKTKLNYDPEKTNKKIPIEEWLGLMGRTKHLLKEEYREVVAGIQEEVDRRFVRLKEKSEHPLL